MGNSIENRVTLKDFDCIKAVVLNIFQSVAFFKNLILHHTPPSFICIYFPKRIQYTEQINHYYFHTASTNNEMSSFNYSTE